MWKHDRRFVVFSGNSSLRGKCAYTQDLFFSIEKTLRDIGKEEHAYIVDEGTSLCHAMYAVQNMYPTKSQKEQVAEIDTDFDNFLSTNIKDAHSRSFMKEYYEELKLCSKKDSIWYERYEY